jgi:PEP-CTERM motif
MKARAAELISPLIRLLIRLLTGVVLVLPLAANAVSSLHFVPYRGAGNVSVFGATDGGWVGQIRQLQPPVVADPLALVPTVLFSIDPATDALSGRFAFETTDLASTLYGKVTGTAEPGFLRGGGQLSLNYTIFGGSGSFAGARGIGLAYLDYDPGRMANNYGESGLLEFSTPVPEPAALALFAMGLIVVVARRRTALPLN